MTTVAIVAVFLATFELGYLLGSHAIFVTKFEWALPCSSSAFFFSWAEGPHRKTM